MVELIAGVVWDHVVVGKGKEDWAGEKEGSQLPLHSSSCVDRIRIPSICDVLAIHADKVSRHVRNVAHDFTASALY